MANSLTTEWHQHSDEAFATTAMICEYSLAIDILPRDIKHTKSLWWAHHGDICQHG
jgi:hypothetical protein